MSVATTAMTMRGVATDLPRPIFGSAAAASRRAVNWLFHHVQAISILSMHQFVRLLQQNRDMAKFYLVFGRENPLPIRLRGSRAYARLRGSLTSSVWTASSDSVAAVEEKKSAAKSPDCSPCWISPRAAFHPTTPVDASTRCRRPPTSRRRRPACRAPYHKRPRRREVGRLRTSRAALCEGATGASTSRVSRARSGGMMR